MGAHGINNTDRPTELMHVLCRGMYLRHLVYDFVEVGPKNKNAVVIKQMCTECW